MVTEIYQEQYRDWPESIMIEPTTACNLRCPLCPTGNGQLNRPVSFMDFDLYSLIVSEVSGFVSKFVLYGQGEPFLHKQLVDMVSLAKSNNIKTYIATNGHFLQKDDICEGLIEAGLTSLSISVDGASDDIYRIYRVGGDFLNVIEGVEKFLAIRRMMKSSTPRVQLQFLVFKHNEHEIEDIRRLASRLGVDRLKLKSVQIYSPDQAYRYLPENHNFRRYDRNGLLRIRTNQVFTCWHLANQPFITTDGKVLPCCFDKDGYSVMGSLESNNLHNIWNCSVYNGFRRQVSLYRRSINICMNCTEGLEVPYFCREEVAALNNPLQD